MLHLIKDIYFSSEPIGSAADRHRHNVYQMICVTEGTLTCEIAGNRIDCAAPSILFIGNNEPHILSVSTERYERCVLTLDPYGVGEYVKPSFLQTVFSFHPVGFTHVVDIGDAADEILHMLRALLRETELPPTERTLEGEALLLSALLYRVYRISPSSFSMKRFGMVEMVVSSVRMELECDFAQPLDLRELADRYHVSRYYLSHAFKQITGYSLKEYLTLSRISYACQLLSGDTASVREIAEASGFHDVSNFSRSFKSVTGMTPSEYRKKTVLT